MPTRFQRDTAVVGRGDGRYDARFDRGWWLVDGPNGGYVAAILLRALTDAIGDPTRSPRSLSVHFAAQPTEGEVAITTSIERQGRSVTYCSARLTQGDKLVALAVAAFSTIRSGPDFCEVTAPDTPRPDEVEPTSVSPAAPPVMSRWDVRWAIGLPPARDLPLERESVAGGWIRLEEPQVLDAPAVTALMDAWTRPVLGPRGEQLTAPALDLTVHLRTPLPLVGAADDDFLLAVFRTRAAAGGFLEEDGEVWSTDGRLIARSRQLAVVMHPSV